MHNQCKWNISPSWPGVIINSEIFTLPLTAHGWHQRGGNINPHVLTSQSISQQVLLSILITLVNTHSLAHTPAHTGCNYWAHTALTSATAPSCDQKASALLMQHASFHLFTLQNILTIICYWSKWTYMIEFFMNNAILISFMIFCLQYSPFFLIDWKTCLISEKHIFFVSISIAAASRSEHFKWMLCETGTPGELEEQQKQSSADVNKTE